MEARAKLLDRCFAHLHGPAWAGRMLLAASLLAVTLLAAPPALAQAPRIAIGELTFSHQGPDNAREYIEIANLGDTPWNPNNHWILRVADPDDVTQLFVRIQGVDPVPPGGVLLVEWGRPLTDPAGDATACTTKGNLFCTGRENSAGEAFSVDELRPEMSLAVYAPTTNNEPPSVADGTMLAYYFQGDVANIDRDAHGYNKAVQSKLWKDGDAVPTGDKLEWGVGLRMGPPPYPATHGTSAADYFLQLSGFPTLTNAGFDLVRPPAPSPATKNRPGTPGQPNYLHPGQPLPGQIAANFWSVRVQAFPVSLAQNAPPAAMQVVALGNDGRVATSLFNNNAWSPLTPLADVKEMEGVVFVNNPQRSGRTLLLRGKGEGAITISTATGDQPFAAATAANVKAQFTPVAVVDAQGREHILVVETGSGNILHGVIEGGKLGAFEPIAGATTNAPVAAAVTTDPAGLAVLSWKDSQLVLYLLGADGKFGAGINIGSAFASRLPGIAPALNWNPQAKRLEVVAVTGTAEASELQHARIELTATEAKVGAVTKIAGIDTNAPPAIAVNPETGQVRMLVRGGGPEPGISPRDDGEPGGPQSGFVLELTFDGNAWSAPKRLGIGRLPGPSAATPRFTFPVAPETIFDPNTKRFQDFLIGEDGQIYHSAIQ
jgi:hypothetical protein